MSSTWFHRWFRRNSVTNRGTRRRARLELLHLEDRALPSTWDGGGTTNNWMEGKNWVGDVAPVAGADLVFPTSSATSFNNFPDGTTFNSITFSGSGYTISGAAINLGNGGITSSATSGINRYTGAVKLARQHTIDVASGGSLELTGVLSGSGSFEKTGGGTLTLNGPDANTYTGLTTVEAGVLLLDKGPANGFSIAIPGDLDIHGASSKFEVKLARDNQIADTSIVYLTPTGTAPANILFEGFNDTIGGLNMTGGGVDTRHFDSLGNITTGTLTLNGGVTAKAAQLSTSLFAPAAIRGRIKWVNTATFIVTDTPGSDIDLDVQASISGDTLKTEGSGLIHLGNAPNQLEVNAGEVSYSGIGGLAGGVILRGAGMLTGGPRIAGPISAQGGLARTLDDNQATFSPATIWDHISGTGFGNTRTQAQPASVSGTTTATWVFTNLPSGFYRVFATWPVSAVNSAKVKYSIFDGTALRDTAGANQELHPTGGPEEDGHDFQQLAGLVKVVSGTLKVQLTNEVATEADGASVIADAIRVERLAGTLNLGGGGGPLVGSVTLGLGSTYQLDLTQSGHQLDVTDSFVSSGALLALKSDSFTIPAKGTAFRIINNGVGSPGTFSNAPDNLDTVDLLAGGQRHIFSVNYSAGDGNDVDLIYKDTATQVRDLKLSPDVIKEGGRVTLHGALTDPNTGDVLSLRVDWGDGTAVQTFTSLGTKPFAFQHVYAHKSPDGSPYEVRAEWFDQQGEGNFRKLFVTVNGARSRQSFSLAAPIPQRKESVDFGTGLDEPPIALRPDKKSHSELRYPPPRK